MTRAHGRKNPVRSGDSGPDSAAGRNIGESLRQDPAGSPIPGQTGNITNYETPRQVVATEPRSKEEFGGMMAHGVPEGDGTTEEHAFSERGGSNRRSVTKYVEPVNRPTPVPVYVVEGDDGPKVLRSASPRNFTVANSASDATRIAGKNINRMKIGLLNEDTATNIRFAHRISDLTNGGGALLPWPTNSYLWIDTQDELYACTVSATLTVTLSVIEVFEKEL